MADLIVLAQEFSLGVCGNNMLPCAHTVTSMTDRMSHYLKELKSSQGKRRSYNSATLNLGSGD